MSSKTELFGEKGRNYFETPYEELVCWFTESAYCKYLYSVIRTLTSLDRVSERSRNNIIMFLVLEVNMTKWSCMGLSEKMCSSQNEGCSVWQFLKNNIHQVIPWFKDLHKRKWFYYLEVLLSLFSKWWLVQSNKIHLMYMPI